MTVSLYIGYSKQQSFFMIQSLFSSNVLGEFKTVLEQEKQKLFRDLGMIDGGRSEVPFPEYGSDEEENAAEVADYETNVSIEMGLKKSLRDVQNALLRIEDGTYGMCKYCGNPIPLERLKARPTSSSCITCKKTITQEV